MKNRIIKIMAVVMTAIFVLCGVSVSAALSPEKVNKDYRNMDIISRQGVKVNKPTAQFAANRVVNGEVADMVISYSGYDCNTEIPTLTCYVGDVLTFTDMSRDNNGGKIIEWDWQRYGALGNKCEVYKRNIVNEESFTLTEAGETTFYLCVKNDARVNADCCEPWSENGNHQTIGRNKCFPNGAYWYFTAVKVLVKPIREAIVHVRYWDVLNNKAFYQETVNVGKIYGDEDTINALVHINDMDGYKYYDWEVQLMDGKIQYDGTDRDVDIILAGWVPEKYLYAKFYPYVNTSVEVRYWDKANNKFLFSETLKGKTVVREEEAEITAKIRTPEGYKTDGWNVQLTDGKIQYEGSKNPVVITLNSFLPKKILNVKCYPIDNGTGGPTPPPTITLKPDGVCDGVIEWRETDSHSIISGYTDNGRAIYKRCNHTFEYKTVLGATAQISPDTLKSGYGFGVDVKCTLNTTMVSNSGCKSWGNNRRPTAKVNNPTTATVFLPWDMTNRLGTQGRSISMVSNGALKFTLPDSPVSETGAKKIYTPVELAGTKESPKSHSFEIYIGGGGVGNIEFCQKLEGRITINGDMYEDDVRPDRALL